MLRYIRIPCTTPVQSPLTYITATRLQKHRLHSVHNKCLPACCHCNGVGWKVSTLDEWSRRHGHVKQRCGVVWLNANAIGDFGDWDVVLVCCLRILFCIVLWTDGRSDRKMDCVLTENKEYLGFRFWNLQKIASCITPCSVTFCSRCRISLFCGCIRAFESLVSFHSHLYTWVKNGKMCWMWGILRWSFTVVAARECSVLQAVVFSRYGPFLLSRVWEDRVLALLSRWEEMSELSSHAVARQVHLLLSLREYVRTII